MAQHFSAQRRHADLCFLPIHCTVALLGYLLKVPHLLSLATLLTLCGSIIPTLLYWALPAATAARLRTPIFTALKLSKTAMLLHPLATDFFPAAAGGGTTQLPPPRPGWLPCVFHLLFSARMVGYIAPRPGAPGMSTLFDVSHDKFALIAAFLDWPFQIVVNAPAVLHLSGPGLCTAVYLWTQLVSGALLPGVVAYVAERSLRRRFLGRCQVSGEAGAEARAGAKPGRGITTSGGAASGEGAGFPWAYTWFAAQACWCLVRTGVVASERHL
ncbi:hypothetical protein N2152v2_003606 [Parachlorella kessleri]